MAAAKKTPGRRRSKKPAAVEYPDTPSGRALQEVGNLDGEDAADSEQALEHGERYAAAKRKHRWGTGG